MNMKEGNLFSCAAGVQSGLSEGSAVWNQEFGYGKESEGVFFSYPEGQGEVPHRSDRKGE